MGRAAEKLQAAAREMAHVATVVEATSQPMARRDPLRAHMDIIYKEVAPLAQCCSSVVETALEGVAPDAECRRKAWWTECCGTDHVPSLVAGTDIAVMIAAAFEQHNACLEGLAGELSMLLAGGGRESDQADSGCQG